MRQAHEMPQELRPEQLDRVAGGMKTDPNFNNPEVIDARGGYFTILGETITYDLNGKVTSVSQTGR
jgi:hypothetical protein